MVSSAGRRFATPFPDPQLYDDRDALHRRDGKRWTILAAYPADTEPAVMDEAPIRFGQN
jgi:hypothetical protein